MRMGDQVQTSKGAGLPTGSYAEAKVGIQFATYHYRYEHAYE